VTVLFDNQKAAEQTGVSTVTIDRLRRTGKMPYRKLGNLVRFLPQDIESFIEKPAGSGWTPKSRT
jgi:excisionase family DNA binding protein